jgi:phenylpropionate dioxygenase-like ring-hydroxylating dioxygenase large terminal subunit
MIFILFVSLIILLPVFICVHKCNLKVFEGLIFINLSENPCDFEEFIEPTREYIEFHKLRKAKI